MGEKSDRVGGNHNLILGGGRGAEILKKPKRRDPRLNALRGEKELLEPTSSRETGH